MKIPLYPKVVRVTHPEVPFAFNVSFVECHGIMFMAAYQDHEKLPKKGKHRMLDRQWLEKLSELPLDESIKKP